MLTQEQIKMLVQAGGAAPSGGNIQPWRISAGPTELAIWLDGTRSTSFLDIGRYASVLALGSFAENVAITARELDLPFTLDIRAEVTLEAPMLVFHFPGLAPSTSDDSSAADPDVSLADYIPLRCTNRRPHEGPAIAGETLQALAATTADDCYLSYVGAGESMREIAQILGETDALRLHHAKLHKQMWEEVRFTPEEVEGTRDGVDVATLELAPGGREQLELLRNYEFVKEHMPFEALVEGNLPALMASSHLCCLSIHGPPTATKILVAGRALQRLWLTATRLGLAIQPWSVLPFLLMRIEHFPETGFSGPEQTHLLGLRDRLIAALGLTQGVMPLFTFRLARCAPPSTRALRRDWRSYTTLHE